MKTGLSLAAVFIAAAVAAPVKAESQSDARANLKSKHRQSMHFTVSVTNLTKGISFTPFLAATHKRSLQLFNLGEPASEGIAYIAEAGDTGPLMSVLESDDSVHSIAQTEGLLGPGETVTFEIDTSGWFNRFGYFSLAAMLLPTNDTFV
ncbi:MAG: spondin domain-containing protein, partial [Ketobacter sp.]